MGAVQRVKTKLGEAAIWGGIAAVVLAIIAGIATGKIGTALGAGVIGLIGGFLLSLMPKA